jgi:hypothetical protein
MHATIHALVEAGHSRRAIQRQDGNEVVAAKPADLALDAAFLVGALDSRRAVERLDADPP